MPLGALRIEHEAAKAQSPVGDLGKTADRRPAGPIEFSKEGALAGDGSGGALVLQRQQQLARSRVLDATGDADRA